MLPEHCQKILDAALSGLIKTQDEKKTIAVFFYELFEYTGDPSAAFCLAELYRQGIGGVSKNLDYAKHYYSKLLNDYPHQSLKALAHCCLALICVESESWDYEVVHQHYLTAYQLRNSVIGPRSLLDNYLKNIYQNYISIKLDKVRPQDCEYYINQKLNISLDWHLNHNHLTSPKFSYNKYALLVFERFKKTFPSAEIYLENDSRLYQIRLLLKNIQHEILINKINTNPTANINDDVLSVIFSKLPAREQASVSIVCQQWRQAFLLSGVFQTPTEQQLGFAHAFLRKNPCWQKVYDANEYRINPQSLTLVPGKPHLVKIILDANKNITSKHEAAVLRALGREDEIIHPTSSEIFCSSNKVIELANYHVIIKFFKDYECAAQVLGNGDIAFQGEFVWPKSIQAAITSTSSSEQVIPKAKINEYAVELYPFMINETATASALSR
jgi:hypothetical protein